MQTTLSLIAMPLLLLGGCAASTTAEHRSDKPSVVAQRDPDVDNYVAQVRAELSNGKVNIINDVMKLTPAEGAAFWPVYSEYEEDLFALGDRRLDLISRFVAAYEGQTLTNGAAESLASDWLKLQRDSADLMQTYYRRLAEDVSPLHAAQFLQIEHRTNTVIDLVIASKMPWVMQQASPAAGANK